MEPVAAPRGPLRDGERVLLLDAKDRRYLVTLRAGGTWHSHGGALALDPLIGAPEGTSVQSATGMAFTAFRPRLADVALKMPRGANHCVSAQRRFIVAARTTPSACSRYRTQRHFRAASRLECRIFNVLSSAESKSWFQMER